MYNNNIVVYPYTPACKDKLCLQENSMDMSIYMYLVGLVVEKFTWSLIAQACKLLGWCGSFAMTHQTVQTRPVDERLPRATCHDDVAVDYYCLVSEKLVPGIDTRQASVGRGCIHGWELRIVLHGVSPSSVWAWTLLLVSDGVITLSC